MPNYNSLFKANNKANSNMRQNMNSNNNQGLTNRQNATDSNNFMMGINPNPKPSDELIQHIQNLEKNNKNKNKNLITPFPIIVEDLIVKLESEVGTLNNHIKNFNKEKKEIVNLDTHEINKLKEIIRTMYILVLTVDKSFDLKKNNRIDLLTELRKTLESSPGLLNIVDEIMINHNGKINNKLKNKKENKISLLNNVKINSSLDRSVESLNTYYNGLQTEIEISEGIKSNNNKKRFNKKSNENGIYSNNNSNKTTNGNGIFSNNNSNKTTNDKMILVSNNRTSDDIKALNGHKSTVNRISSSLISKENAKKLLNQKVSTLNSQFL